MRRFVLLSLGIAAVTWLEFQFFPGHTYLQSDTQIYLPILEHIDTPNFLLATRSRRIRTLATPFTTK